MTTDCAGLVITARDADVKLINRVLLHLRDWTDPMEDLWDWARVLRTVEEVAGTGPGTEAGAGETIKADSPPISNDDLSGVPGHPWNNPWEGLSILEVEKIMMGTGKDIDKRGAHLFVVLDDTAVKEGNVIIAQRVSGDFETGPEYLDEYNKVRVPYHSMFMMWTNLNVGNMGFEDWCDREIGCGENRWWVFSSYAAECHPDEGQVKRDAAFEELKKLDMV